MFTGVQGSENVSSKKPYSISRFWITGVDGGMESSSLLDISTLQTDSLLGDGSLLTLVNDGDVDDNNNGSKEDFEGLLEVSFEENFFSRTMIRCVKDPISYQLVI